MFRYLPRDCCGTKATSPLTITKFQEKREEKLRDNIFDGIKSVQGKALELLGKMEEQGDYRGAVLAAREAREALLSANELLEKAEALRAGSQMAFRVEFIGGKKAESAEPPERVKPLVNN